MKGLQSCATSFIEPDNRFLLRCNRKPQPHCLCHLPQSSPTQHLNMQSDKAMGWETNPLQLKLGPMYHRQPEQRYLLGLATSHQMSQHKALPRMFWLWKSCSWHPRVSIRAALRSQLPCTLGARGPGNQRKHLEYIAGSG